MNSIELFRAGKLNEAIQAVSNEVREDPLDLRKRTSLFELLCFAGDYDRAEKQLEALAQGGQNAELGTLLYRAALHAERERCEFFETRKYLEKAPVQASTSGSLNGKAFHEITDADPRIGARFEVFMAGRYVWIPLEHLAAIHIEAPKRLRDLIWCPVLLKGGAGLQDRDIGEVLTPVLTPLTSKHSDDAVRLGRATVWEEEDGLQVPFGQRLLLVDGEEVPLLELRDLEMEVQKEMSTTVNQ